MTVNTYTMDRWKQRHSLNLDTRAGLSYLSKIFNSGSSNVIHSKSSISKNDVSNVNGNGNTRHYAGLQPLSPCWEMSDSFTHCKPASPMFTDEDTDQIATAWLRLKTPGSTGGSKRPYSICGPIMRSHSSTNYSKPSPSQIYRNDPNDNHLVKLGMKRYPLVYRCRY